MKVLEITYILKTDYGNESTKSLAIWPFSVADIRHRLGNYKEELYFGLLIPLQVLKAAINNGITADTLSR